MAQLQVSLPEIDDRYRIARTCFSGEGLESLQAFPSKHSPGWTEE